MIREADALYRAALAVLDNDPRDGVTYEAERRQQELAEAVGGYRDALTERHNLTLEQVRREHNANRCADACPFCRGEVTP